MTAAGFCSDQQHEKVVLERCVFLSTHFVVLKFSLSPKYSWNCRTIHKHFVTT